MVLSDAKPMLSLRTQDPCDRDPDWQRPSCANRVVDQVGGEIGRFQL
jgi:hypothetical protein